MEQEALPVRTITVENLGQGGITLHWDELVTAIRESIKDCTERTVSNTMLAIRDRRYLAWAIWVDEQVQGVFITQPVTVGFGTRGMVIYALYGHDMELDEWQNAIAQFSDDLKRRGCERIIALTDNPRVLEIVASDGWKTSTYCEKEL